MAAKTFNTTEYQSSHGHTPRGAGTWMFALRGQRDNMDAWVTVPMVTFTEAKKQLPAGTWIVLP